MSILDSLNALTKTLLGVGIIDAWKQAPHTKEASEKAARLAQNKHLREAVMIAEKALAIWSRKPGFWERLICQLLLGKLLDNFTQQVKQWRYQVAQVDKLAANAKTFLKQDTGDPLETEALANAIAIYQRCTKILHDDRISRLIKQYQEELQGRQQFLTLVTQAQSQAENRFYKNAIAVYREAEKLYSTESLQQAIAASVAQVQQEEIYDAAFEKVQQAESEGRLQGAIALLKNALAKFSRPDGIDLLEKLQQTLKGREQFRQGLAAEKAADFKAAVSLYRNARLLLPNSTSCQIRLALVAIKTQAWATALTYLEAIPGEQAAYLRGFAYAQQEDLQVAYKEWLGLSTANIAKQREILKNLSQRQRLLKLQNIEQLVAAENWEKAKAESTQFLQKFGSDPLVEENLNEHIQPRLEAELWKDKEWKIIADQTEKAWISQPNITTLHNLAVANYYLAQTSPINLLNLIFSLSTALANITKDPSLQDVPWLENKPVEFAAVSLELKRRIETAIDMKDTNIIEYLYLRDRYRLEAVSLNLMGEPAKRGMKIKDVYITPVCYQYYLPQWQGIFENRIHANQKILSFLYTNWGLAVAACLEGDYQRAIQLKPKPSTTDKSYIAAFAQKFVAYHEGYYQLQQQKWREAIIPLKQAKPEIQASQDWQQEIDRLCGLQRQVISNFQEHLEFAQFWYDFLGSRDARSYLAEYKAEQIREQIANEQISSATALKELQKLKEIDNQNPIVIDLIERIEFNQELELIDKLLKNNKFEEAVQRAKESQHQRIRNIVSDIFVEILIKGFQNRDLGFEDIYQLGYWAYELCPDDPNVQEIYRFCQELKDIENLMKCDRFDEAVHRAKYSQHNSIRHYVAEFFIKTLLKGIQNRNLSFDLIQQLGRWAYQLCPDEPAFQEIYRSLNIR
ncbi:peptidase M, neutral zinc metallopeptidase site [Nostoc edaphicum CCNP1411]|uniref:Peptidase M, neutral zinc metallopeptidase site n=1 Tax=Nostoc edaphicum CCNP1411 TaxID=1472755 RepID=A0A7D7QGI4_9NOSO|nr:peptidase M, neutral zinc metallopeptidase site [Nostoc edaphicum]QMS89362.1 peptidase M, neutral zinc metallopeptidase site [Nostoc edaphicum CCNP1411]